MSPYRALAAVPRNELSAEERTDAALRGELARDLRPGEELLWVGRPYQRVRFRWRDIPKVLFCTLWCGGVVHCCVAELLRGELGGFLCMIPFVMVAAGLMGWPLMDVRRRGTVVYGLTERRVLLVSRSMFRGVRNVVAFDLQGVNVVTFERWRTPGEGFLWRGALAAPKPAQRGSVYFGLRPSIAERRLGVPSINLSQIRIPVFEGISDLDDVLRRVEEVHAKGRKATRV